MEIVRYAFSPIKDDRGQLIAIEEYNDIPFSVKRLYYIYGVSPGTVRGRHAHKNLQQILICVHGSCKILLDDGNEKRVFLLDRPNEGLYVPELIWREMYDFSEDAVLLVLASELYDESDYIRDYSSFLAYVSD